MIENQLQQGDVILNRVSEIPEGTKKITDKRGVVLAEGEHTGHYHGITDSGVELLEDPKTKKRFVRNSSNKTVKLKHQEHNPVFVAPGMWEIGGVKEYDYFQEMERQVVD